MKEEEALNVNYRRIGQTDLYCTGVAIGTWGIGGDFWGDVDDEESIRTIRAGLDAGLNIIDTAPIYGKGRSETVVGRAIQGYDRSKLILATKVGMTFQGERSRDSSRTAVLREIDDSLRRLGTDYVDLYQVHWPDADTPFEETFTTLDEIRKSGKARYIGVSNFSPEQLEEAARYCPISSVQPPYSLLDRAIEADLLPYSREHGLGVLTYGSIGAGALTGKFKQRPVATTKDKRANFYPHFSPENWPKTEHLAAFLGEIAQEHDCPTVHVAINWVLKQPGVSVALVGAKNPEQARMNAGAAEWSLTDEENARIQAAYERIMAQ